MRQVIIAIAFVTAIGFTSAGAAPTEPSPKFFLGQHLLYSRSFLNLQENLFDGLRIWGADGTTWAEIEPTNGHFDFSRFDKHVTAAKHLGIPLIYTLGQTPKWASARPDELGNTGLGAAAEPRDIVHWERYVRAVATRYKGQISAYEIMNEPRVPEALRAWSPGFFSGSVNKLAEMTVTAAAVIRQVDPSAKIVCPSMDGGTNGIKRLDYFLKTQAAKSCDVIGFHYYLAEHSISELRQLIRETRRTMSKYGLGHLPLWNTETGVLIAEAGYSLKPRHSSGPLAKMFTATEASNFAAKVLVVSNSSGVDRTYWFAHDSSWMGSTVADKRKNQLNEFGLALALIKNRLSGNYLRKCTDDSVETQCEIYSETSKIGAVYWGSGKKPADWIRQGYSSIEYVNGKIDILKDLAPANLVPLSTDMVVFLK